MERDALDGLHSFYERLWEGVDDDEISQRQENLREVAKLQQELAEVQAQLHSERIEQQRLSATLKETVWRREDVAARRTSAKGRPFSAVQFGRP